MPCMEARKLTSIDQSRDYQRIATAITFLNAHPAASLEQCAQHLHLSPEHFQKLFSRWAGVSPKQYARFLQKEYAKAALVHSKNLLEAADNSQLSGTARLYDLFIQFYGMTPAQYRAEGKNMVIDYGKHPSPFGDCLIAITDKGICKLAFYDDAQQLACLENELRQEWPQAQIQYNPQSTQQTLEKIFSKHTSNHKQSLKVLIKGTEFQIKVWEALLKIPQGNLVSYSDLASAMEQAEATRAVSSAVARNKIALLIPCHRVIKQNGVFNQYRWGATRKQAMIAWEASQTISKP